RRKAAEPRREADAVRIDEAIAAPTGGGDLLHHQHRQAARPIALDAHGIDPWELMDRAAHRREIHREQALAAGLPRDDLLDLAGRDVLEPTGHPDGADRLVQ